MLRDRDRAEAWKIHIRLVPDLHRRLRIPCAKLDVTIQGFVVEQAGPELGSHLGCGFGGAGKGLV